MFCICAFAESDLFYSICLLFYFTEINQYFLSSSMIGHTKCITTSNTIKYTKYTIVFNEIWADFFLELSVCLIFSTRGRFLKFVTSDTPADWITVTEQSKRGISTFTQENGKMLPIILTENNLSPFMPGLFIRKKVFI